MLKKLLMLSCLTLSMLLISCAATMPGPGGVSPAMLVTATTSPGDLANIDQRYAAYPDSFQILGAAEGSSSSINILGLIAIGQGGYSAALEDAKASVGADGIINATGDVSSLGILGLFASSKTTVKGIAIKLK